MYLVAEKTEESLETDKLKRKQEKMDRDLRFLSKAIYKTLRHEGCQAHDIISVSTQLLSLVTGDMEELEDKK